MIRTPARRGFTIIELLVAMALIVLIMAVLSEAFVAALGAFRQLKALGDMQERLRVASSVMRSDLQARHFEGDRKLSDDDLFWVAPPQGGIGGLPTQGFLRIQGFVPQLEGIDPDNILSTRVDPANVLPGATTPLYPVLHLSVKLGPERGDALRREQLFSTKVTNQTNQVPAQALVLLGKEGPAAFQTLGLFNSPWAEVAYFLVATGETAGSGVPLFTLYRRVRLVPSPATAVQLNQLAIPVAALPDFYGVSCQIDSSGPAPVLYFNSELDLAQPPGGVANAPRRSMMDPTGIFSAPAPLGTTNNEDPLLKNDDLLVSDVINFQVQVLRAGSPDFQDVSTVYNQFGGTYDTANPLIGQAGGIRILALKITLRIWEFKTQQVKQVTMVVDM